MKRYIDVFLGEPPVRVGTLYHDRQGSREHAAFEYSREWLARPNAFALEPQLPLFLGPQYHRKQRDGSIFHLCIADTEPDGWGRKIILRDHAKRRSIEASTTLETLCELDFLLAVDDFVRVGALRFRDETGTFLSTQPSSQQLLAANLKDVERILNASKAFEDHLETPQDLAYLLGRGTSLGGLRPKCSVINEQGRLAIAKFPSITDERSVTKGEILALTLAHNAGINAARGTLTAASNASVAIIERFDRKSDGIRIPYISAATMLGAENPSEEHSYTELVDVLRQHGSQPQSDIEELWRRMIFSILITNVDDHLHNHGFLYDRDGRWRLSPAFDLNPFPERRRELKLWISESTGPGARIDSALAVLPYFKIPAEKARSIVRQVEGAVQQWRQVGVTLGFHHAELTLFEAAFEHEERLAARSFCTG